MKITSSGGGYCAKLYCQWIFGLFIMCNRMTIATSPIKIPPSTEDATVGQIHPQTILNVTFVTLPVRHRNLWWIRHLVQCGCISAKSNRHQRHHLHSNTLSNTNLVLILCSPYKGLNSSTVWAGQNRAKSLRWGGLQFRILDLRRQSLHLFLEKEILKDDMVGFYYNKTVVIKILDFKHIGIKTLD